MGTVGKEAKYFKKVAPLDWHRIVSHYLVDNIGIGDDDCGVATIINSVTIVSTSSRFALTGSVVVVVSFQWIIAREGPERLPRICW